MRSGNRSANRYKAGAPRTYWRGTIGRTARAALAEIAREDAQPGVSMQETEEHIIAAALLTEQARRRKEADMKAQDLYDRRDIYGEISGSDLHDLFNALIGDPSPAGRTPIDPAALAAYADDCRALAVQYGTQVPDVVHFADQVVK